MVSYAQASSQPPHSFEALCFPRWSTTLQLRHKNILEMPRLSNCSLLSASEGLESANCMQHTPAQMLLSKIKFRVILKKIA